MKSTGLDCLVLRVVIDKKCVPIRNYKMHHGLEVGQFAYM